MALSALPRNCGSPWHFYVEVCEVRHDRTSSRARGILAWRPQQASHRISWLFHRTRAQCHADSVTTREMVRPLSCGWLVCWWSVPSPNWMQPGGNACFGGATDAVAGHQPFLTPAGSLGWVSRVLPGIGWPNDGARQGSRLSLGTPTRLSAGPQQSVMRIWGVSRSPPTGTAGNSPRLPADTGRRRTSDLAESCGREPTKNPEEMTETYIVLHRRDPSTTCSRDLETAEMCPTIHVRGTWIPPRCGLRSNMDVKWRLVWRRHPVSASSWRRFVRASSATFRRSTRRASPVARLTATPNAPSTVLIGLPVKSRKAVDGVLRSASLGHARATLRRTPPTTYRPSGSCRRQALCALARSASTAVPAGKKPRCPPWPLGARSGASRSIR